MIYGRKGIYKENYIDVQQEGDINCQEDDTKKNFIAYDGLKQLRIHTYQELSSIAFQYSQYSRNTCEMHMEQYITPEPFKIPSRY